jgi:hypothetical protein
LHIAERSTGKMEVTWALYFYSRLRPFRLMKYEVGNFLHTNLTDGVSDVICAIKTSFVRGHSMSDSINQSWAGDKRIDSPCNGASARA